ncbi:MAG: DUF503 family protein [Alicyclobacillus sp.]|nr:DUF503 family protein [Alicyclobacillus sp.]
MTVGVCTISLSIPGVRSLKEKRGVIKPLVAHIRKEFNVSVAEVEDIAAGRRPGILLDARAPERYRGDAEPLDPKAGHIPGALNAPWTDNVHPDGSWLPPASLRDRWREVLSRAAAGSGEGGGSGDRWAVQPLVVYCGSGVTACANLFALERAGISGAKLYAGSWSDWCSYPHLPVETGESEAAGR